MGERAGNTGEDMGRTEDGVGMSGVPDADDPEVSASPATEPAQPLGVLWTWTPDTEASAAPPVEPVETPAPVADLDATLAERVAEVVREVEIASGVVTTSDASIGVLWSWTPPASDVEPVETPSDVEPVETPESEPEPTPVSVLALPSRSRRRRSRRAPVPVSVPPLVSVPPPDVEPVETPEPEPQPEPDTVPVTEPAPASVRAPYVVPDSAPCLAPPSRSRRRRSRRAPAPDVEPVEAPVPAPADVEPVETPVAAPADVSPPPPVELEPTPPGPTPDVEPVETPVAAPTPHHKAEPEPPTVPTLSSPPDDEQTTIRPVPSLDPFLVLPPPAPLAPPIYGDDLDGQPWARVPRVRLQSRRSVRIALLVLVLAICAALPWAVPQIPDLFAGAVPDQVNGPLSTDPPIGPPPTPPATPDETLTGKRLESAGTPREVTVKRLHVNSEVVSISGNSGELIPPSNPQILGWWQEGRGVGFATGSAVVTGHTVSAGGGAFDHLGELAPGDRISVRTDAGTIEYIVRESHDVSVGELARTAESIFKQTGPGRLVLITCSDFNGKVYLSNSVVYASPIADKPTRRG